MEKIPVIVTVFVLLASLGAAAGESLHPLQAQENADSFDDAGVLVDPGLDLGSLLFAFLDAPEGARPGQEITLSGSVTSEKDIDASDTWIIIEVYDCFDNGCDDGEKDEFVEALRINPENLGVFFINSGEILDTRVDYTVPDDAEGSWAAVIYLWDRNNKEIISFDVARDVFEIDEPGFDTDDPPRADIDGPTRLETGETGKWESGSTDEEGPITDLRWELDGTPLNTKNSQISRSFTEPGEHRLTLTVWDSSDQTSSDTLRFQVTEDGSTGNGVSIGVIAAVIIGLLAVAALVFREPIMEAFN